MDMVSSSFIETKIDNLVRILQDQWGKLGQLEFCFLAIKQDKHHAF